MAWPLPLRRHRYVYHPLDKLYIVLITNKHSNIMEDLSMLQLLSKLIPDLCGSTAYDVVQANVFQVLFAFDEVITSGGYKEDITVRQVRQNMEMNSHDERLALLIRQSKINEANVRRAARLAAGCHRVVGCVRMRMWRTISLPRDLGVNGAGDGTRQGEGADGG